MKKITLALFAVVSAFSNAFGQAIVTPTIPTVNSSTQVRLPNGTVADRSLKGCMLIRPSEMSVLTASLVNSLGMIMLDGTDPVAAAGNFSIYAQTTSDVTNQKIAGGYNAAISTMTMIYNGAITIPTVAATVIFTLNCTPQLTINPGDGLYLCYQYEQTSVTTNTYPATWAANNAGTGNGLCATSSASVANGAPDALIGGTTDFRPSWIFRAVNTATNEVSAFSLVAPGKVAKLYNAPQQIVGFVRNNGINTLNNVNVSLNIGGANSFAPAPQVISSIAPGAVGSATFTGFNPIVNGINTMSLSVASDQNNTNNMITWTQSVTCNELAVNPPNPTFTGGFGFSNPAGSGIISVMHNIPGTSTLSALRFRLSTDVSSVGEQIFGVLMDSNGQILNTSTNTITVTNTQPGTYVTFNFGKNVASALTANQDYYFGVAQPQGGHFPFASIDFTPYPVPFYYSVHTIAGSSPTLITNFDGFFSIEPIVLVDGYEINASATKTVVCKGAGETVTLTASGADNYTWTPTTVGSGSSFTWAPIVAGAGTATQITVYGTYTAANAAGCRSNSVSITFSLPTCVGIDETAFTGVELFPNPAVSGVTSVHGLTGSNTIVVYNTLGQVVIKDRVATETYAVDLSSMPSGSYVLKITNEANESKVVKFVNQR